MERKQGLGRKERKQERERVGRRCRPAGHRLQRRMDPLAINVGEADFLLACVREERWRETMQT